MFLSNHSCALALTALLLAQSCAGLSVSQDVSAGRIALQTGRSNDAVTYLSRAAAQDPNYQSDYRLPESVLSILGRAYYESGRDTEARATLEKALAQDKDDHLARLYLGLTLARSGERERGAKEIQSGLRGVHNRLEYLAADSYSGIFWDPTKTLRNGIKASLEQKSDSPELIASAREIGSLVDREIDLARRDEINLRYNRNVDSN
jgi:tetratricopeptide (TPR) repeat protein